MTDFDTNVSNYTLSELLTIVEIDDEDINHQGILDKTNQLIKKFKVKNPILSNFFKEVQTQLLQYAEDLEAESDDDTTGKIVVDPRDDSIEGFGNMSSEAIYPAGEKQMTDWYENENLTQSDKNQESKN